MSDDFDCMCGAGLDDEGYRREGCTCCDEDCPEGCMADHKGEQ